MKVLDLQCSHHHSFEGWFASQDDFESQLARGLVACPLCADTTITKKLSAPRLNLSAPQEAANVEPAQLEAALMKAVRQGRANTEDVCDSFT